MFPVKIFFFLKVLCYIMMNGLGIFRIEWEVTLQHLHICRLLYKSANTYITEIRNLEEEQKTCINKLQLTNIEDAHLKHPRELRNTLRLREYDKWCGLGLHGKGAVLYQEYTPANRWIESLHGVSTSEWIAALKLQYNMVPVRALPGRSRDGIRCRYCNETETLAHVLGSCPRSALLRNTRHHMIRSRIASALKQKKFEVFEEVSCIADGGSSRRIDIIAIDRNKNTAIILDPTVRCESGAEQPNEVHLEKCKIYEPTIRYFQDFYNIQNITVMGLLIGARGSIPKFVVTALKNLGLGKELFLDLALLSLKGSIQIVKNHLYNPF